MSEPCNYFQITPDIATSGQPMADQFADIAAAGYDTVINLAMYNSERAIPEEGGVVTEQGMTYVHLPVPFDNPGVEHLRKFIRLMSALEGSRVWVHCVVNKRVSAFMYHYLTKVRGIDERDATSPILSEWVPHMEEVWRRFMNISSAELGL